MTAHGIIEAAPARPRLPPRRIGRLALDVDPRAVLSIGYLVGLLLIAIFAAKIAPYRRPSRTSPTCFCRRARRTGLGTDDLGRDVLSRLIWGAPNRSTPR